MASPWKPPNLILVIEPSPRWSSAIGRSLDIADRSQIVQFRTLREALEKHANAEGCVMIIDLKGLNSAEFNEAISIVGKHHFNSHGSRYFAVASPEFELLGNLLRAAGFCDVIHRFADLSRLCYEIQRHFDAVVRSTDTIESLVSSNLPWQNVE